LKQLLDIVVEEDVPAPTDFVFTVTLTDAPFKITLASDSDDHFNKWIEELN